MPKGIPNKRYTPEFKKIVIETMLEEKLSYSETARRFEVSNHHRIQEWERIYLTEGPEGFAVERRGRKNSSRSAKSSKTVEEDLIAENQRLRAENEYLKNLQALVLEEERRRHRKRRWSKHWGWNIRYCFCLKSLSCPEQPFTTIWNGCNGQTNMQRQKKKSPLSTTKIKEDTDTGVSLWYFTAEDFSWTTRLFSGWWKN